jgi:hypothetical protein
MYACSSRTQVGHAKLLESSFQRRRRLECAPRAVQAAVEYTPRIITVYRNGDTMFLGARMLLLKRHMLSFEQVVGLIGDRVSLSTGCVRKLYTVDGDLVTGLSGLVDHGRYVAVGHGERLKLLPYGSGTIARQSLSPPKLRASGEFPSSMASPERHHSMHSSMDQEYGPSGGMRRSLRRSLEGSLRASAEHENAELPPRASTVSKQAPPAESSVDAEDEDVDGHIRYGYVPEEPGLSRRTELPVADRPAENVEEAAEEQQQD